MGNDERIWIRADTDANSSVGNKADKASTSAIGYSSDSHRIKKSEGCLVSMFKLTALLLTVGLASCTSTKAPLLGSKSNVPTKPSQLDSVELSQLPRKVVREVFVQNDNLGVKTVTVRDAQGDYVMSCNLGDCTCINPVAGRDYYLFAKETKTKIPGTDSFITTEILLPVEGDRTQAGIYWLNP
jgi:hypothetical protein